MLHFEDRQSSKKGCYTIKLLVLLPLLLLTGCDSWDAHKERNITMEAFSDMKTPNFIFDLKVIRQQLHEMVKAEQGSTEADKQTCNYYRENGHPLLWIDDMGVDERADSLMAWLQTVKEIGFSEQSFDVANIIQDMQRMRSLDFENGRNDVNHTAARLEYHLTKACLRYCYGQCFGFINPHKVFNELDAEKTDTLHRVIKYRELFDVKMDLPGPDYVQTILHKVRTDSIAAYLREIQPQDKFYSQLKKMLQTAPTAEQRRRIIVNMERSRWRLHQPIPAEGKRVVVNIPAYHLYASGNDEQLDMRVVCGNVKTKTPLLSSYIEWMEVNPQWVIPTSIIENEVSHRAGDSAYFARNKYRIIDKATNQQVDIRHVTKQMLLSGKYRVAQDGGAGNSLGRVVFRFKNKFSVFLHDTSNPGAFERDSRAISHGCVRVSKPFDLARFVLDNPDEWLLDRIRIAMGRPAETERGQQYVQSHPDTQERLKLIGYVPVKPRVPIYIIYYTLWPDTDGRLETWPDVYGYDDVVWNHLKPYMKT